ncbi:MAG: hypothetical protein LBV76_01575 [Deltaproteobacteria bacterium]|nr:hypothetical protein [Deltaproteobacteria bacterium]
MQAYQAYIENGKIIPIGNPTLPDGYKAIITILDETVSTAARIERQLQAIRIFEEGLRNSEPLLDEFDDIICPINSA